MLTLNADLLLLILTAGEGDPPDGDDPPADDPPADDPPDEDETPDEDDTVEEKVPIADLRKIRAEAAKYRKQLRDLEAKVDASTKEKEKADAQAKIDKLDGLEKEQALTAEVNKQLAEANATIAQRDAKIKSQAIGSAVYSVANAAGFHQPEQAASLIDLSELDVIDGEVNIEEVTELVNTLAESSPFLLKEETTTETGGGPSNPGNPKGGPKVKFTGDAEIAQLKKQSKEAQARGDVTSSVSLFNKAWEKEHGVKPG